MRNNKETVFQKWLPHGINAKSFYKPNTNEDLAKVQELRKKMFGDTPVDFVVMYNNRNIRRKMTGNVIIAYRKFLLSLPIEQQERCRLLLHTTPIDDNGTDLPVLIRDLAPEIKCVFSADRVDTATLNLIYANADVIINLANAEGWGLGTHEALMAEKMTIATVSGGLQDQAGFRDENDNLLHEDIHYNAEFLSNAVGKYTKHGEWTVPLFPKIRALIGSPPTPYIFEDHCSWEEAADAIRLVYDLGPEERARRGALGRQFCIDTGLTAETMCNRFITGIDTVLEQWVPREKFALIKST